MALLTFDFESLYLGGNTQINVIMPDIKRNAVPEEFYRSGKRYPVLWLLHGGMGDYSDWVRKSNIELYACEHDLMVVMPSGFNSSYANWEGYGRGYRMYDFVLQELMPMIHNWFPASHKKEDNFIAGMSMGGAGTLKFILNNPERFQAAACISCTARKYPEFYEESIKTCPEKEKLYINLVHNNGGIDAFMKSKENMRWTIEEIMKAGRKDEIPPIYACIGTDDGHYKEHIEFKEFCREIGFDRITWNAAEHYKHEWRYWDRAIQEALEFFGFPSLQKHE